MDKLIVIAGATAASKTSTAVAIANKICGEIISCDSMQIYRKMNIGTAKVTPTEMSGIPHHMIDVVDYDQNYTAAGYASAVKAIIADILSRGKQPILCGGTGLYIDSVIYPFNFGTAAIENLTLRDELYTKLDEVGALAMHAELSRVDIDDANKIHPNNTKRLIRALEIYYSTGKTKSQLGNKTLQYDVDLIVLDWDREQLYKRIDQRVDTMFDNGIIEEVKSLAPTIDCFDYQSMHAIGYAEFKDYLYGESSLCDVITNIKLNSRHYAKRQITWFKKYDFAKWLTPEEAVAYYN